MEKSKAETILNDADFQAICARKNTVSISLAAVQLVIYFGFVALIAYNKPFLGRKIWGSITLGIPVAVGTILLSCLLTGIYIYWANDRYDRMVKDYKKKLRG